MTKLSLILNSHLNDLSIEISNLNCEDYYTLDLIQERIQILKMLSSKIEGKISDKELDEIFDKAI
jgi:hypothetical protein